MLSVLFYGACLLLAKLRLKGKSANLKYLSVSFLLFWRSFWLFFLAWEIRPALLSQLASGFLLYCTDSSSLLISPNMLSYVRLYNISLFPKKSTCLKRKRKEKKTLHACYGNWRFDIWNIVSSGIRALLVSTHTFSWERLRGWVTGWTILSASG